MESSNKTKALNNLSDSPITDEGQDRLRRTPFIESLCGEITNLPFEDSFCFGLYGGWGEGKTSVFNLIKVFAPILYDDIYENWWFYVKEEGKLIDFLKKLQFSENIITPEITPALIRNIYQNSLNTSIKI